MFLLGDTVPCTEDIEQRLFTQGLERHLFLLGDTPHQQIEPIADLCGYSAPSFLKRIFKKKTGLTMRAWRKRAADRGPAA